jgi:hypothetical protein
MLKALEGGSMLLSAVTSALTATCGVPVHVCFGYETALGRRSDGMLYTLDAPLRTS